MLRLDGVDFLGGHPDGAQNAVVRAARRIDARRRADIGKAQVGAVAPRVARSDRCRAAPSGSKWCAVSSSASRPPLRSVVRRVPVAGRLVESDAVFGFFLDHQEAAVLLDDGARRRRAVSELSCIHFQFLPFAGLKTCPGSSRRLRRGSGAASGSRLWPSCAVPDGSCLRGS